MAELYHREWRDEQQDSNYPFADFASLTTTSGYQLTKGTFLDAVLHVPFGAELPYLISILLTTSRATLYVGDEVSGSWSSVSFNKFDPDETLRLLDAYGRDAGILVVDPLHLAILQSWTTGLHEFVRETSEFVPTVCQPIPKIGLSGILVDSEVLSGELWLVGENGIVIRHDQDNSDDTQSAVRIDLVGDPLFLRKLCAETAAASDTENPYPQFVGRRFLKTINGIRGNSFGEWHLTTGSNDALHNILRIVPDDSAITIKAVGQPIVAQ